MRRSGSACGWWFHLRMGGVRTVGVEGLADGAFAVAQVSAAWAWENRIVAGTRSHGSVDD